LFRIHVSSLAILLAVASSPLLARQAEPARPNPLRDPDRGLELAFRARLALVDPARDSWAVEHWNASIELQLRTLSALWAEDRLESGLAEAAWIAPELRVAALDADAAEGARLEALPRALAAWRRNFPADSRLDFEVQGFEGSPPLVQARLRLCASGGGEGARAQHNATWSCTWSLAETGAQLVGLALERFESIPQTSVRFSDITESAFEDPALFRERFLPGLEHWRRRLASTLFPGSLGHHGLAVGDVDGNGLEDLYVCRPGGLPNQLLLHTPRHTLLDASAQSGADLLDYSSSALLLDLDGDFDLDLVVSTGTGLVFFANDGAARFERKLLLERSLATSMAAADYDADGDLDLFVCSYLSPYEKNGLPVPYHDANNGEANMLLRNDGAFGFVDVAAECGMDENNRRFSLAAAWEDFDNDGDQDLYVANDFGRNNLYRNEGGRFRDVAAELSAEDISAGMGVTWADVDHDGWMDLYVTNMHSPAGSRLTSHAAASDELQTPVELAAMADYRHHAQGNTLLINQGGKSFRDAADRSGTAFGRWGWGSIFLDFDNDGALDLFAPNGFVSGDRRPDLDSFFWRQVVLQSPEGPGEAGANYSLGWRAVNRLMRQGYSWNGHERNVAYWNRGEARFSDVSSAIGLDHPDDSRAAVRLDWDNDGDEDLVLSNRGAPMLRLLENQQTRDREWIAVNLYAADPHKTAVGARVVLVSSDGARHLRTLRCGEGYLAQSSSRLHFGLGSASVQSLSVRWPDGTTEAFGSPATRSVHVLVQGSGAARPMALPARAERPAIAPAQPAAPAAASRTVLPTPLPLPRLLLESWDAKPASLLGITQQGPQGTGQPLLLLLWSVADSASRAELERLGAAADVLQAAGLRQILALCVDAGAAERERAVAAWKDSGWPFARGFVSEEGLSVLELVKSTLHDDAQALELPVYFLIDARGQLAALYQGAPALDQVRADLGLFALTPEARREAAVPFPGRWISPLPQALDADVAARLLAHGLERPASEYELARVVVREFSAADFEFQTGVARQRQGRLADAIGHYRRALAANPGHAQACQALAVALHQQGEFQTALTVYRQALTLEPAHALTRLNLGYLFLAMNDVEGAQNEVRALQTLRSELAATLELRIAEFKKK